MGGGYANQFLAIWHALKNDAAQRDILEAAAKEARENREYESELGKKLIEEIHWINVRSREIADLRDDALHSPLWGEGGIRNRVLPVTGLGHVRAQKLMDAESKRGLLTEFRWCRDAALVLTDYVRDIDDVLSGRVRKPWPQRPALPNRGQTKSGQRTPRVRQAKRLPPPRSSRG